MNERARDPTDRFGQTLRRLRKQRGLTQEQLAFETGLNRQFLSLLELGQRAPSLATVYKVSAGLSLSGSQFLAELESTPAAARRGKSVGHTAGR